MAIKKSFNKLCAQIQRNVPTAASQIPSFKHGCASHNCICSSQYLPVYLQNSNNFQNFQIYIYKNEKTKKGEIQKIFK